MKKLNKTEREVWAKNVIANRRKDFLANHKNSDKINQTIKEATQLLRKWQKQSELTTTFQEALNLFISENKTLVQGDWFSINLVKNYSYNPDTGTREYGIETDFANASGLQSELEDAIVLCGIDAETTEDLEAKVLAHVAEHNKRRLLA
tara:strand:- start:304 stop:750 length:447 start_codon:yes stop_codon:yes gene_type:complete